MSQYDNRRKFKRVQVESLGASLSDLTVQVSGIGTVNLYDISYGGAAFSQPPGKTISVSGDTLSLDFMIHGRSALLVSAKVVRLTEQVFAVEFLDNSQKAKSFVDRLISHRMVGLNMNLIDPSFYSGEKGFSYWFHGPKNTNLYLWEKDGALVRATLDLFDTALHWQDGLFQVENKMNHSVQENPQSSFSSQEVFRQSAEILSQMRTNVACLKELQEKLYKKVLKA